MTSRTPPHLIVIDLQKGFQDPIWGARNNPEMENVIEQLLNSWRLRSWPVIFVQHVSTEHDSPLRPNQAGVELMGFLQPRSQELMIHKSVNSAFIGTKLESILRDRKAESLVFVGLVTDHCVSTSVRMAANLGFKPTVISDGCATFDRVGSDGKTYPAQIVHEVSLASLQNEFAEVLTSANYGFT